MNQFDLSSLDSFSAHPSEPTFRDRVDRCRPTPVARTAFTILELLVVMTLVAILTTLLLASISKARASTHRATCQNHLRQIALSIRMYADDMNDLGPSTIPPSKTIDSWTAYKQLLGSYVGRRGGNSSADKLFLCPSDQYHYSYTASSMTSYAYIPEPVARQPWSEYSSYAFNGGNARTNTVTGSASPGIAGVKLSSIREPTKTVLVAEYPAFFCFSWHAPQNPKFPHYFNNAPNMVAFVDGHVRYTRIFYDTAKGQAEAWQYDPPAEYDYKWSAE